MESRRRPGGPAAVEDDSPGSGRELRTSDFEYELPDERIARYPAERRDESRLLAVHRGSGRLEDLRFRDLRRLVEPGDALVLNDTRVFPARLRGRKPTGARAEVFLLEPLPGEGGRRWTALVRPGGKLKPGRRVIVSGDLRVAIENSAKDGGRRVRLEGPGDPWTLIERHGEVPLPPYLGREPEPLDRERYQTVYAERTGSVAAPTAGFHFTPELLAALERDGVRPVRITLHVGIGTFRPVDAGRPRDHTLPAEEYEVSGEAADALNRARRGGGRVWAVGTTAARTLETVVDADGRFRPGRGRTDLFLYPPYRFRGLDRLLTNFHLPRSSLVMLVAALAGRELTLSAYRHAVEAGYRFYSYGDAMAVL